MLQVCPGYEGASLGQLSYQYSFVNQNGQPITDKNWGRFLDAEKSAFVYLYLQWDGSSDDEPSDFTSESESDTVSFQLLETKPKKPQRKYENGAEVPSILIREGRAVTFQDSPHIIPPRFPSDPASPAFLAENFRGRKASPDRFYRKSHNWDHSQHQPLRLSRSLENNSPSSKRNLSPDDLLISQSPKLAKVNWESVNWEQVRPRRKRTEDEEPHGHRDPKVRRVPTLDRSVEGKHTTHHHHHHHGTLRKQSESSRRRHSYRFSRQIHEEITDIYWVPPSRRSSLAPSVSISETSPSILQAKFNNENATSSELSAETDRKENQANSTDVKVKKSKRSTKLPSRSVSPNPQNTSVLPIFTWPTVDLAYIPNKALPLERFTTQTNLAVPESQSFVNTPQSVQMDDQTLAVVLADAHDRLSNRKGKGYRDLYQAAVENTIQDVEAVIEQLGKVGIGGMNIVKDDEEAYQRSKLIENRDKKQLLDLAKRLCDAFIPANYRCSVTKKYWGAIHSILSTKV